MRVGMIAHHGCIRVFKETVALQKRGYTVDVIANQAPFGYNRFETVTIYHEADQLRRAVASSPADLFHVHNEPDWMVGAARDATDKPIVYDIHDLESLRWQREPDADENRAFEAADAYVHVSEPCKAAAEKYHAAKPNIVLYPYVNEEFVPDTVGDVSWTSLVYEGGLSTDPLTFERDGQMHTNMRNYSTVVGAFTDQSYNVFLIGARAEKGFYYENFGAVVTGDLIYPTLMAALRPFAFGLVGSVASAPLMESAMPNKLFEYISQGVVPVVLNCAESARWVQAHNCGIVLDGLENLREQLADGKQARANVLKIRRGLTMENHIEPLIELYETIL